MKLCYILLFILLVAYCLWSTPFREGYETLETCMEQGYPKDFCLHVPLQSQL